ncbi:SCO family protein [Vitreoscilla massiliensis]|uniref:SCO family protein n=1 Tax=Vitreoscilla massiliensis TaxID=1689272 RepID=A0ABY4E765_9NEIS|nr:SCO family protein [Vitreoscilla massiliensis]UOO91183.1 SCO family protein [Vitreoscilla massiliensis]
MKYVSLGLAVLCAMGLSACQPSSTDHKTAAHASAATNIAKATPDFHGSDISAEGIGGDFSLTNQDGKTMTLADFKGKLVVLSFGYTRCPDVCPTTLLDLAQVMTLLGDDAKKVQVVFVSVDPTRDTPAILKDYVPLFNDQFIGLTAKDDAAMAPVLKTWKIAMSKVPVKDGHYSVDHSAGMYVLDANGKAKLYLPYATKPEQITADLKALLK